LTAYNIYPFLLWWWVGDGGGGGGGGAGWGFGLEIWALVCRPMYVIASVYGPTLSRPLSARYRQDNTATAALAIIILNIII